MNNTIFVTNMPPIYCKEEMDQMPINLFAMINNTLQEGEKISKTANKFLFANNKQHYKKERKNEAKNANTFICN